MDTETLILLAIYFTFIFFIIGFLGIFFFHIKQFKEYAPLIMPTFRFFIIATLIVATFGGYKIITGEKYTIPDNPFDVSESETERQDF